VTSTFKILPRPPFSKEGVKASPFEKGGLRGIFSKEFLILLQRESIRE
jgi:hypothetical protein